MQGALKERFHFIVIICVVVFLRMTPLLGLPSWVGAINTPLEMIAVFFHEMSHGIGALLTGGGFYSLEMAFGQGGIAHTGESFHGFGAVSVFCGYFGPSFWGLVIYLAFARGFRGEHDVVPTICMWVVLGAILIWVRDIRTAGIVLLVAAVFQAIARFPDDGQTVWAMKFLSVYLVFAGGYDPYSFFRHPEDHDPQMDIIWDGQALADLTNHGVAFWVHIWVGCSAVAFLVMFLHELLYGSDDTTVME